MNTVSSSLSVLDLIKTFLLVCSKGLVRISIITGQVMLIGSTADQRRLGCRREVA